MKALCVAVATATVMASSPPVLAASEPSPGATSCSGCHTSGAASSVSRLYGRNADEIMTAMTGFRDGSAPATVMNRIAKGFSDDESRAIAAWLATQK